MAALSQSQHMPGHATTALVRMAAVKEISYNVI
jgi:hypothetical protein